MTDTLIGMTHAFMADSYITNTYHTKSRLLLRRMVIFVYMGLVDQALEDDGMCFDGKPLPMLSAFCLDPDVEHLPNPAKMDSHGFDLAVHHRGFDQCAGLQNLHPPCCQGRNVQVRGGAVSQV